jgi:hypothetical protein
MLRLKVKAVIFCQCCGSGFAKIRIRFGWLDPVKDKKFPAKMKKFQVLKRWMFSFERQRLFL